jgi:DNA invertase Pin-like site-specific DNA recombinase
MTRAVIYARISRDSARHGGRPKDEGAGVERQIERCTLLAQAREWELVAPPLIDNDLSAFNGKHRPAFTELMGMISRREVDAVLIWHIDRLCRRMAELVDIARLCRDSGVKIASVQGDYDFSSPLGRMFAHILVAVAEYESEHKGERQAAANLQAARAGKRHTGPRPFGTTEAEAEAIRWAADALLGGSTISAVTREWGRRGLRPPQNGGGPWRRNSVSQIMRNPALAGLRTYRGEIIYGDDGEPVKLQLAGEDPILARETWEAVRALLEDPARKPPRGVRTLLGGMARCRCGNVVTGSVNAVGQHVYRCNPQTRGARPGPHCQQQAALVDEYVQGAIIGRLARPDLADLVAPRRPDLAPLHTEAASIRANLDELAADRVAGLISRSQMLAATERGNARLAEIGAELAAAASTSALAPFTAAASAAEVWEGLDGARQRAVIGALADVVISPAGRGARTFDPDRVSIDWHTEEEPATVAPAC